MKMFFVLISFLALTSVAYAQGPQGSPPAKKKGQSVQASEHPQGQGQRTYGAGAGVGKQQHAVTPTGRPTGVGIGRSTYASKPTTTTKSYGGPDTTSAGKHRPPSGLPFGRSKHTMGAQGTATTSTGGAKSFKAQRFNLQSKSKPTAVAPSVTFRQGSRIQGSQNWTGSSYTVFRNYSSTWHDRTWWHSHYNNIVFVFGGWYYWNSNYWYPAWGYDPYAYYFYDGPIYAYNDLPPDQVIANVQAALQQQGYYQGEVDGILGPLTRAAIANYQRDNGLYITSAIDEPTLAALGMV
jgi:hypothetical protein